MKTFISRILLGLFLSVIVYVLAIAVAAWFLKTNYIPNIKHTTASYGHTLTRLREAEITTDIDVLILGSSHAYRGFDTRIFEEFGFKTFNLGSSIQTPTQSLLLYEMYQEKMKPRIVILEVFPSVFSNDGVECAVDLLSNHEIDLSMIKLTASIPNPIVLNSFLYNYFWQLKRPLSTVTEPAIDKNHLYVKGGFVEYLKYTKPVLLQQPKTIAEFKQNQVKAFKDLLTKLSNAGTTVHLVQAPVPQTWYSQYKNEAEIQALYKQQQVTYPNVKYYDYSKLIEHNMEEYFYDQHHLNQKGVRLFNERLIQDVILPLRNNK